MNSYDIYKHIAERTQGNIYVGVVGPARTGKSTFIKRFMELLVIPNIEDAYIKDRARDELPQSSAGKTIMTVEPKFIPEEAIEVTVGENIRFKVRLIDCVGYLVKNAIGHYENNIPRMISTPWFDYPIPFAEAAEFGTRKVITDHSTVGILVTTDGTITDLSRDDYTEAERRVVNELKALNKPFIIVLNSTRPSDPDSEKLRQDLENSYSVPVMLTNCAQMSADELNGMMERVLLEFPVCEIGINFPRWVDTLEDNHWLRADILNAVKEAFGKVRNMRQARDSSAQIAGSEYVREAVAERIDPGEGSVIIDLAMADGLFYRILSETSGIDVDGDHVLISLVRDLANVKREYTKLENALHEVKEKGYGIVMPDINELTLDEPEIIRQGHRFGVRLRASAPSIHMIRADIETEIAPLVGTEKESEELVNYLLKEFENEPAKIWQSNIFGKSVHDLVNEGLRNKLNKMPEDARLKLQETLQRIVNEGTGALICIIL